MLTVYGVCSVAGQALSWQCLEVFRITEISIQWLSYRQLKLVTSGVLGPALNFSTDQKLRRVASVGKNEFNTVGIGTKQNLIFERCWTNYFICIYLSYIYLKVSLETVIVPILCYSSNNLKFQAYEDWPFSECDKSTLVTWLLEYQALKDDMKFFFVSFVRELIFSDIYILNLMFACIHCLG